MLEFCKTNHVCYCELWGCGSCSHWFGVVELEPQEGAKT